MKKLIFFNAHIIVSKNTYNNQNVMIYKIMADLKVDTDIVSSIAARPTVMYVEIFKTGVIVFISDIKMCLTLH